MKITKQTKNIIFLLVRLSLIFFIIINLLIPFFVSFQDYKFIKESFLSEFPKRIELVIWSLVTLVLSFSSSYIEKKNKIQIPEILQIVIVLFIYAAIFLSVSFNLYYRFFWWDDLLHTLSGVIIGFIGFLIIYRINYKYNADVNPIIVILFSFSFAVMLGVFWEIFEFSSDVLFGTAMQKWDLPSTTIMMGKDYQGSGLRDTMSDLIVDCAGALITSLLVYFIYRKRNNNKPLAPEKNK